MVSVILGPVGFVRLQWVSLVLLCFFARERKCREADSSKKVIYVRLVRGVRVFVQFRKSPVKFLYDL